MNSKNMKKIGIITPYGNSNYGNKLQNYALQESLKHMGFYVETFLNEEFSNTKKMFIVRNAKNIITKTIKKDYYKKNERYNNFISFNNNIDYSKNKITAYSNIKDFDYVITGSDQVWNPYHGRLRDVDLLCFVASNKRISYAASFGVSELPEKYVKIAKKYLNNFKCISVREEKGKEIVEKITNRKDVEVLIDPTMLLTSHQWDKISKKPNMLKNKKYILNYFLGKLSDDRKKQIEKIAEQNNCEIINILDPSSLYYTCGPSEFLYLEKNAFLICTDSFHSCVFAILFERPFLAFSRDDNSANMESRIDTLLSKFDLNDKRYSGTISSKDLMCDYSNANKVLEYERNKSIMFLKKALDIKENK